MNKYVLSIDGMMCGMCEAHINDVIRKSIPGLRKLILLIRKMKAVL